MSMIQLNPPIPVNTPKGEGFAYFLIDCGLEHDDYWKVLITKTGEWWTFNNREVRGQKNITLGRTEPTPLFGDEPLPTSLSDKGLPFPNKDQKVQAIEDEQQLEIIELQKLVELFSAALFERLIASELKHRWNGFWKRGVWASDLQLCLDKNLRSCDYLNAAAYVMFAWHAGWPMVNPGDNPSKD